MSGLSEFDLIQRIQKQISRRQLTSGVQVGIGDDCAVLQSPKRSLIVTTDLLVEGVHFRRDWMSLPQIGVKAMAVNLSDIAAMGGTPRWAFVSVGLPRSTTAKEAMALHQGLAQRAAQGKVAIAGGDTNAARDLTVNVVVIGEAGKSGAVLRSGARVGDSLYVTGSLGGAALGLMTYKNWGRHYPKSFAGFIRSHVLPPDRLEVGKWLAAKATSMIDVSDGLLGDLGHILERSHVGAEVCLEAIPLGRGLAKACQFFKKDPVRLAMTGGEDYELLFTASASCKIPGEIAGVPVTKIGNVAAHRKGLSLVDSQGRKTRVVSRGFTHQFA